MTDSHQGAAAGPRPWPSNPFLELIRLPRVHAADGTARVEFVVEEVHLRHGGIAHGGALATVLDTVAGHAAYSIAPPGAEVVTIQMNLNLTATARSGDRVVATAHALHHGRRTAVIQGELRRSDGRLLAAGSITVFFVHEGLAK